MKIIRISTFLDYGGIETKMANLATVIDKNDWIFCAIGKGGRAVKMIEDSGKKVVCLDLPYNIPNIRTVVALAKFLQKEKPDVLHTSGAEANFFGFVAGKIAGVPKIIVEEIGMSSHSKIAKKIFGFIFRNATVTVGESAAVVNNLRSVYNLESERVQVIHNFGLFNKNLPMYHKPEGPDVFKILMISRLEPVKNIEGVINVVARLKSKFKVKLMVAGSGQAEVQLRQKVKELQVENDVVFLGYITDPYPHLLASDLYILNSFSEGFSNSLVEAMYSKTPSLSTSVGAAPEIITDGVNGFLVPADDEQALHDRLTAIIKLSREQRKAVGEQGYLTVTQNFSLEKHVAALMEVYKK